MTNDTVKKREQGIISDFGTVIEDAQALVAATTEVASEKVVEARKRLAAALESAQEVYGQVRDKANDHIDALEESVRENPYKAIGTALAVGAFIGMLLLGRSRRE